MEIAILGTTAISAAVLLASYILEHAMSRSGPLTREQISNFEWDRYEWLEVTEFTSRQRRYVRGQLRPLPDQLGRSYRCPYCRSAVITASVDGSPVGVNCPNCGGPI